MYIQLQTYNHYVHNIFSCSFLGESPVLDYPPYPPLYSPLLHLNSSFAAMIIAMSTRGRCFTQTSLCFHRLSLFWWWLLKLIKCECISTPHQLGAAMHSSSWVKSLIEFLSHYYCINLALSHTISNITALQRHHGCGISHWKRITQWHFTVPELQ